MITYTKHPLHKGEWGPISGHVLEGETLKKALIRETKEELDLDIEPIKQIAQTKLDIPKHTGFWRSCKVIGGKLKPNEDVENLKYYNLVEIKNLKLWPATRKFFENYIW